jgi:site-specific recombinase XerD
LKIYSYTWDKWKGFRESKGRSYDYQDLNFNLLNEFRIYLKNQGLQLNTVSKYIKTIKSFLSYLSLHKELPVPASYKKVSVEKEEPEIEVLTQEELEVLKRECFFTRSEEHQISEYSLNEREKLIGHMLIFMCHTGLSYVDFDNLKLCHLIFPFSLNSNVFIIIINVAQHEHGRSHQARRKKADSTINIQNFLK